MELLAREISHLGPAVLVAEGAQPLAQLARLLQRLVPLALVGADELDELHLLDKSLTSFSSQKTPKVILFKGLQGFSGD